MSVLDQPHRWRNLGDGQIVTGGWIGEASPLLIGRVVIVPAPGFGVAQYHHFIILTPRPDKIDVSVDDHALAICPGGPFIGCQTSAVAVKIELSNGINPHFTGLTFVAYKIKYGTAG